MSDGSGGGGGGGGAMVSAGSHSKNGRAALPSANVTTFMNDLSKVRKLLNSRLLLDSYRSTLTIPLRGG